MNRYKREQNQLRLGMYQPVIVVMLVVFAASLVIQLGKSSFEALSLMQDFMGLFLVIFAMFKLFDIPGFAEGFSMYDIVASRFKLYGFVYPFIELFLGLSYLSRLNPVAVYIATIIVMAIGSMGVIRSLLKGMDVNCACLGTFLKVPLSTIAIIEDAGMGVMALIMFLALL